LSIVLQKIFLKNKVDQHLKLKEIQRSSFNSDILELTSDRCLILLDYTRFHETAAVKLHDLNFTVYSKAENGELYHEFFDFFSNEKQDWTFTKEGVTRLSEYIDLKSYFGGVRIWGDNGFHNHKVLYVMHELSIRLKVIVTVCYFAPHHGWSICDTHFGHGKVKLRRDFSLDLIRTVSDIVEVFKKLQNTTVEIIEEIPKPTTLYKKFKPESGKMSNHYYWQFLPTGVVYCKENYKSDFIKLVNVLQ
jgi:hypothetical protein